MFHKNYNFVFFLLLILGTLISVSANSWFTAWLGLEINLMSMIPLILVKLNTNLTEAAIKYFLAQALASTFMIFSSTMMFIILENNNLETWEIFITISLSLKAGMAPFHFWFPQVSLLINWTQCMIIFTWQKIAPLILFMNVSMKMLFLISIFSALTGAIGGFNQSFLKLLMTYSSIGHSGWMVLSCGLNYQTWIFYFLVYSFLSLSIINQFNKNQILKIKQIFKITDSNPSKNILILNMMSLGGMPPLLGFSAKIMVLWAAVCSKILLIIIPLIVSSLISLFFYMRVFYSSLMNMNKKLNLINKNMSKPENILFSFSVFLNIICPVFLIFN